MALSNTNAPNHALLIQSARAYLKAFPATPENLHRAQQIEVVLSAYERLAATHALVRLVPSTIENDPETSVDFHAEYEAALEARDAVGFLGTGWSPAETIHVLADDLRDARQPVFSDDLSVATADGKTTLTFCDGKYSFILAEDTDYLIEIKRYGRPWSINIVGPGQIVFGRAIGCLAAILGDAHQRARAPK